MLSVSVNLFFLIVRYVSIMTNFRLSLVNFYDATEAREEETYDTGFFLDKFKGDSEHVKYL